MPSSYERDLHSEAEYLKQASRYVGLSQPENAIVLLERARLHVPVTNRLLNALGKLYLTVGKPAQAVECFQSVLNRKPKVKTEMEKELPLAEDMQYMAEQSHQLLEKEYSFETPDEPKKTTSERKILSLVVKNSISDKRTVFNNRPTRNINEKPVVIQGPLLDLIDDSHQSFDTTPSEAELIDIAQGLYEEYFPLEENNDFSANFFDIAIENEEEFTDDYGMRIVDAFDNDLTEVVVEVPDLIEGIDYESQELPGLADDTFGSLDIYDHWSDDLLDDIEEDINTGVLNDRLSREQRAQQAAIDCLETIGWNKSSLSFVTEVFVELGWNNAKKALEREALNGATHEELSLAFHIKQIWAECDRYWISFTGAWLPGETTSATYRNCSWRQALRLISVFNGVPSPEEVWDLVEDEFDFWYDNSVLRNRFPAFSKYLFSYRLNESLPTLPIGEHRRFDLNVALDEMDAPWSHQPQSDEIRMLSEHGIDVINRYTPKSYYTSDIIRDLKSLDLPSSKKKSKERVFNDEVF